MLEDISRYEGLVDAGVFVRVKVLQRVFGDALMLRGFCRHAQLEDGSLHAEGLFAYLYSAA
jgi:hypothetical protein